MQKARINFSIQIACLVLLALLNGPSYSLNEGSFAHSVGSSYPVECIPEFPETPSVALLDMLQRDEWVPELMVNEEIPEIDEFNTQKKEVLNPIPYRAARKLILQAPSVISTANKRVTQPPEC